MGEIVLVHGAWHGAWCWDGVVDELRRRGMTATAVELPFTGFEDDVAAARAAMASAGPGAVVCAHSYGGVVVNEAVQGLGHVGHIVYLAAFVATGEPSLFDGQPLPLLDAIVADGERCHFDPSFASDIFYADSEPAVAEAAAARFRPMVLEGAALIGRGVGRLPVPSTYVVCTQDRAIPPALQYRMAELSPTVLAWPTDHSPFLTRPGAVADLLIAAGRGIG